MSVTVPPPKSLTESQLDNIQGDIWSKGFPKFYETYYFFSIVDAKIFSPCLKELVAKKLISTLRKVREDQNEISKKNAEVKKEAEEKGTPVKYEKIPKSNALIAFTRQGLQVIESSGGAQLNLGRVEETDPAFFRGMVSGGEISLLNDPARSTWDPLFQSHTGEQGKQEIHGLLKIGGSSKGEVEAHLKKIRDVLKYGEAIRDIPGKSPPTETDSRVDGWTRPCKLRGKEHFGFEDGISQPHMGNIDDSKLSPDADAYTPNVEPELLIVTEKTALEAGNSRPSWMYDGSFLVFRKLEQNVGAFEAKTKEWSEQIKKSKEYVGAKLMGRWPSGAPLAMPKFQTQDSTDLEKAKLINNFKYEDEACPLSSHIRKTHIRIPGLDGNFTDKRAFKTRMIRNGIPYGSEYEGHEKDGSTRGLLFACYQGHIEDGFQNIQANWSNNSDFLRPRTGHDPIIGQVKQKSPDKIEKLTTKFKIYTDKTGEDKKVEFTFEQFVTLKGGDYFFAPSIKALEGKLAGIEA